MTVADEVGYIESIASVFEHETESGALFLSSLLSPVSSLPSIVMQRRGLVAKGKVVSNASAQDKAWVVGRDDGNDDNDNIDEGGDRVEPPLSGKATPSSPLIVVSLREDDSSKGANGVAQILKFAKPNEIPVEEFDGLVREDVDVMEGSFMSFSSSPLFTTLLSFDARDPSTWISSKEFTSVKVEIVNS